MKFLGKFFLLFAFLGIVKADPTAGVNYLTEQFPPFNFKDDSGNLVGMNVEVLGEMFKELGSKKTIGNVKLLPWARGYNLAQDRSKTNVLFSTTRTQARENLFKWVGPLSKATNALITLKGNPYSIDVNDSSFLTKFKFGAIRDDAGELDIKAQGVPSKNIFHSHDFQALIKKLESKRVHVVSYNGTVAKWLLKTSGKSIDDFYVITEKQIGEHYFAFNKSVSDDVIKAHQDALNTVMSKKDVVDGIMNKYK